MIKSILSLSIFGLLGCAVFNPGVCNRVGSDRYPECSDSEISENFNETSIAPRNSFRLNVYNSSWNTSRIQIHCSENDRRMDTMTSLIFSKNSRKNIRFDAGCSSIYLVAVGHGESRRSMDRPVLVREDVCAEVTQTMDIRWNVCSARG